MESTGLPGKIQISKSTAELVTNAGKSHWVSPREDAVDAKGKGIINTFWLNVAGYQKASSAASSDNEITEKVKHEEVPKDKMQLMKQERLVGWMVEILADHIRKIVSNPLP